MYHIACSTLSYCQLTVTSAHTLKNETKDAAVHAALHFSVMGKSDWSDLRRILKLST